MAIDVKILKNGESFVWISAFKVSQNGSVF